MPSKNISPFARNILYLFGGILSIFLVAVLLAQAVAYKPYGVPDNRREEYEAKIAEIKLKNEFLRSPEADKRPVARVDKETHDFGLLDPHVTMSHSFKLTNAGKDPLAIEILGTSCKCTTGKLTDGLLQPDESTDVTLKWNTGYQDDAYEQTATLQTNDPLRREIMLTVKGTVRTELGVAENLTLPSTDLLETVRGKLVVHSQLWKDFEITDVRSDGLKDFSWVAEPVSTEIAALADSQARSAWQLTIETVGYDYGAYSGSMEIDIQPESGGESITRTVSINGKVRTPIAFKSPLLDSVDGLDIGTLNSGKPHEFPIIVRVRGTPPEKLAVLGVEPKELDAELMPTKRKGHYRLLVTIPSDCPDVVFNRGDQHGFVQVGNPDNPDFMNWFPIYGAVVNID